MIGQTPTSLNVNDMRIHETLAKAERSHANRFQKALDTL